MKNLLDTHTLIWFLEDDPHLSSSAINAIEHADAINYVSIGSIWEISIKVSIGKLDLHQPFEEIERLINVNGFIILPISFQHLLQLQQLPFHHRDPFDRLLIAQCRAERMNVIK
ncbi:MAG: type II toxin-antitoxin system VapC family toxin [Bacteroidia bacterium]